MQTCWRIFFFSDLITVFTTAINESSDAAVTFSSVNKRGYYVFVPRLRVTPGWFCMLSRLSGAIEFAIWNLKSKELIEIWFVVK